MRFKKSIIIVLFLLCILTIGAVSASENVTDDKVSNDVKDDPISTHDNLEKTSQSDTSLKKMDDSEVTINKNSDRHNIISKELDSENNTLESDVKDSLSTTHNPTGNTFEDIQNSIDSANIGDIISLSGNYIGSGTHIKIAKTLTIEGNGATLDAKGLSKIFEITGTNVLVNNINFINGKSVSSGAIDWWTGYNGEGIDSNGILMNCKFINCSSEYFAGAVYFCANSLSMYNCYFANNTAEFGGAVYVSGDNCSLINSIFERNNVTIRGSGGALYIRGDNCIIDSCNFYNNFMNLSSNIYDGQGTGGAISCNSQNDVINNCVFEGNTFNTNRVYNFLQISLPPEDKYGAAIGISGNGNESNIIISNCKFDNVYYWYRFYPDEPDKLYGKEIASNIITNNEYYLAMNTCSFNNESNGIGVNYNYNLVELTKTIISVPNVNYNIGSSVNIIASVKTDSGADVTEGKVLFCADNKYYFVNVINGKATVDLNLDISKGPINCFARYIPIFSKTKFYDSSSTNFNLFSESYNQSPNTGTENNGNTNNPNAATTSTTTPTNTVSNKQTIKITAPTKTTFKAKTKTKKYSVTLKNKNKPIKKATVKLTVKGKKYTVRTNNKGKATFKIKNLKKKGKYTAVITYKKIKRTVKIIVK